MKFINYLESISGVGIFPLISLIMFFVFFALVTLYVVKADKKYIERSKNIPLEVEQQDI
jgi:cytochrome c oxidase cbb3-type subunit 3